VERDNAAALDRVPPVLTKKRRKEFKTFKLFKKFKSTGSNAPERELSVHWLNDSNELNRLLGLRFTAW
jgi:hypothetical protein